MVEYTVFGQRGGPRTLGAETAMSDHSDIRDSEAMGEAHRLHLSEATDEVESLAVPWQTHQDSMLKIARTACLFLGLPGAERKSRPLQISLLENVAAET